MRRILWFLLAVSIQIQLIALVSAYELGDITIVADEWYPMNGVPESSTPGYMIEIAQKIVTRVGGRVLYRTMPWEKALEMVRRGYFDCVVGAYKEDAPDFVFPKLHWGLDVQAVFAKITDTWRFTGLDSLASRRVGVIEAYHYGFGLDEWLAAHSDQAFFVAKDYPLNNLLKMLLFDRIDTIVESKAVMSNKLQEMGMVGQLHEAGRLGGESPMYIACSPVKERGYEIVKLMDRSTEALIQNGQLEQLLRSYGLNPWW